MGLAGAGFSVCNFQSVFEKEHVALLTSVHSQTTALSPIPLLPGVLALASLSTFQILGPLVEIAKTIPSSPNLAVFDNFSVSLLLPR